MVNTIQINPNGSLRIASLFVLGPINFKQDNHNTHLQQEQKYNWQSDPTREEGL